MKNRKNGVALSVFRLNMLLPTTHPNYSENVYVRVTGGMKSFGNKRYLNASHIRPVKDAHEAYFHILEAITVSLILEKGPVTNQYVRL